MMNYFAVATVILCGFLGTSIYVIAQLESSTSPDEESSTSPDFSDEAAVASDGCYFDVTGTGSLKLNGTLKPSEECVWNISSNVTDPYPSGLLFEDVILDDDDQITIHLIDKNETLLFGPYHGAIRPLVIAVDAKNFTVKLSVSDKKENRVFRVFYSENCIINVPPSVEVLDSPIYNEAPKEISCSYDYKNVHDEIGHSYVFKNFSLDSQSILEVSGTGSTQDHVYKTTPPDIFGAAVRFNFTWNANFTDNRFTIVRRDVYSHCSQFIQVPSTTIPVIKSPPAIKSYNDTMKFECRWLIKVQNADADTTLRLLVDKLQFSSVLDSLIINDGPSELSVPIVQAALVNQNMTKAQMIRTSGSYMWISFRSEGFASNFSGNYTSGKGGYRHGPGNISVQSDGETVFLLEVAPDERVFLNFSLTSFANPAVISIYDDFDTVSSPIAQLNGTVWYPVISSTSKMMVVAKSGTRFTSDFLGIKSDCIHMSASPNDAYVISGNCNSTCSWVMPPRNVSGGALLLGFQFLSLDINDVIEVYRLGSSQKSAAKIVYGAKQVPPLTFSPREGFYMNITRGECSKKDDVFIVAHTTFVPDCSSDFSLNSSVLLQLSSPNYPNMYPLFANCQWKLTASGNISQFHLTFNDMKLAPNHSVRISQTVNGTTKENVFSGDELPYDMLIGNAVIQFNSSTVQGSLVSEEGFVLNITSSDCGGTMTTKIGTFNTSLTSSRASSSCFWIISVPYKENDGSVNSIIFTVEEKEAKGNNSEFQVYDGPSVRDSLMKNITGNVWSRNNTVIFVYKKFKIPGPSTAYTVNYKTISCNKTMQCGNGICLHPDWLCDGKNDCGDFTDERNCETVPVPDSVKQASGVSPLAFGLVTVLFFGLGALAAFLIPKAINRYRTGRYHQFQDYAGVD